MMRVLGIDPGLQRTGYACVDQGERTTDVAVVEAGVFRLSPRMPIAARLVQLEQDLCSVIEEHRPEQIVVEQLFSHYRHARTAIQMGHARGVVLLVGERFGLTLTELAATEVKKAVTGHGHASKTQIQLAVKQQCGLRELPSPPDVADAIAIALTAARRCVEV